MARIERDPARLFAPPAVERTRRADGSILLRSPEPLLPYSRCIGDWLVEWAATAPDRPFLLERGPGGGWQGVTYAEALKKVRSIGAWLLQQGLTADSPVAILSDNSVEHGLLALAAMHVGITVMPISPAYSLMSRDFGKLKTIFALAPPAVVYVADAARFAPALAAVADLHRGSVIAGGAGPVPAGMRPFAELLAAPAGAEVDRAFAAVGPDTIAKVLFTSGSTGIPKGVINTQRMLCSNQQGNRQLWPFLVTQPPVLIDWLPWNHTFGGNYCFNLVLRNGGTLHVDEGRPAPGLFEKSLANLREVAPTAFFNVPRAYDMLVTALRGDEALRRNFFSRLQLIFYAAAALPQHLWDALIELAEQTVGEHVVLTSSWGSTETAPMVTNCHFQATQAGVIGNPAPGCELKLVPASGKLEVRVRGPNVTPGYYRRPDLTTECFDEEGFYRIGDAVRFVDEAHPELGLLFDGRVAEDFKLTTGTWVNVGGLRVKGLAALAPVAQDIVVAGHDRDEIGFLVFPNLPECRKLCGDLAADAPAESVLAHPAVRDRILSGLRKLASEGTGTSTYATRALLLAEPPSIDAGEITDKAYINQGAVLAQRDRLVQALYADSPDVIRP
ncbi:MAG: feruloyl-CoA synthase [Gammaproteobacteria bacterium]|nr:MAG: feruloyl-CoA synthase [Gammaproteobacteria bacterium]